MTAWEMYWILRLDAIRFLFCAGVIVSVFASFMTPALADNFFGVPNFRWKIWVFCWAVILIICAVCATLTPATKDMKEIYGIEQTQTGGENEKENH